MFMMGVHLENRGNSRMAIFDEAFEKTAAIEGGYVLDPDDAGGETYKGISRRFNPSWGGWDKIDEMKKANPRKRKFDNIFDQDDALQQEVRFFSNIPIGTDSGVMIFRSRK